MKAEAALSLVLALLQGAAKLAVLVKQAQAEGRDVTEAELSQLAADDDAATAHLAAAIAAAKAQGR